MDKYLRRALPRDPPRRQLSGRPTCIDTKLDPIDLYVYRWIAT